MDIKVGDWVVDNIGEYCQVTKIIPDQDPHEDQIYGWWLNIKWGERNYIQELFANRCNIVGSHPTKEVAQIHASVQNSIYEGEGV